LQVQRKRVKEEVDKKRVKREVEQRIRATL
jgi:hypothetical protein